MTGLAGLAVAVGDQLDSRGSALLWSWPPGAGCGLLTGGRSPWGNRCSVGGDRLACPKVTPTAAPCRPPRPLAARRRALTCRPRCWPGAARGWCTPRPPRSLWSGRSATMRSAASRSMVCSCGMPGPRRRAAPWTSLAAAGSGQRPGALERDSGVRISTAAASQGPSTLPHASVALGPHRRDGAQPGCTVVQAGCRRTRPWER